MGSVRRKGGGMMAEVIMALLIQYFIGNAESNKKIQPVLD
jgi:hypothetical protein